MYGRLYSHKIFRSSRRCVSLSSISSNHRYLSTSSSPSSTTLISEKLRNAQASEIFRSCYYLSKSADSSISVNDLDQLIVQERVRPSILIDLYSLTGHGLGVLSRLAPKECGNTLTSIIDESTTQQFNDSIRSMQLNEVDNYDFKETLKYHRDLNRTSSSSTESSSITDEQGLPKDKDYDPNTVSSSPTDRNSNVKKTILTTVVYHMLKLSEKY